MPSSLTTLMPMVEKLKLWSRLSETDCAAILALPHKFRSLAANEFIVREGDRPTHACLLLSGFVFRHKMAGNGARQIFSIHMKGDAVGLHNTMLRRADHNVQALTDIDLVFIPVEAVHQIAAEHPQVGLALWLETLVDSAIFHEWTLSIGRRDARARTAHLLCEFAVRFEVAGLGSRAQFDLPMTQDQLADALALTNVHVSRTLKALAAEGLIERRKRTIHVLEFDELARVGDFDDSYLHLDGVPRR